MTDQQLGRLESEDPRRTWPSEAAHFTPWLARPENLELLGKTLGIDLELEAQEKTVGPFRADILCKDVGGGHWVLIENQLERTDHNHLGQLLTYAAGLQAVTVVWIAAKFTNEHRATLDWLNKITDSSFRFFGLEIELWRIGTSPAAPRCNVVSNPNDWSQSVKKAAEAIDDADLSETKMLQRDYWEALNSVLNSKGGPVLGNKKPQPQSWMAYPVGKAGVHLGAAMAIYRRRIRVELYISGPNAKAYFGLLEKQKKTIEQELGPLDWEELPAGQDSRISVSLDDADPKNTDDWKRQHEWLAVKLNDWHRVFSRRVKELNADDRQPESA
jgi:Domain of unknown function (DUF4268)